MSSFKGAVKITICKTEDGEQDTDIKLNVYLELSSELLLFHSTAPFTSARSGFMQLVAKKASPEGTHKLLLRTGDIRCTRSDKYLSLVVDANKIIVTLRASSTQLDQIQAIIAPSSVRQLMTSKKPSFFNKLQKKPSTTFTAVQTLPMFSLEDAFTIISECLVVVEAVGIATEGLYRISGPSTSIRELLVLFRAYPTMSVRNSITKTASKSPILPKQDRVREKRVSSDDTSWVLNRQSIEDLGSQAVIKQVSSLGKAFKPLHFDCQYENDVHLLTGLVKLILRDCLETNLFGDKYLDVIHLFSSNESSERIKVQLNELIHALPKQNKRLIELVLTHISEVSKHAKLNLMTIQNVSVIFGPTLIKTPASLDQNVFLAVKEMQHQIKAVEALITHLDFIFGTNVVLKSTDTVFERQSNVNSMPHLNAESSSDESIHATSKSHNALDQEFSALRTKDDNTDLKKNRRKQTMTGNTRVYPADYEKDTADNAERVGPSMDTINYTNGSLLL